MTSNRSNDCGTSVMGYRSDSTSTMASCMIEFTEDRVPSQGLPQAVDDLVELFGGEMQASRDRERRFILPLRRGVAVAGGVECTVSWAVDASDQATVTLVCNRDVDAPKAQRIAILVVGVIGALTFMIWPFFGKHSTPAGDSGVDRGVGGAGGLLSDAA